MSKTQALLIIAAVIIISACQTEEPPSITKTNTAASTTTPMLSAVVSPVQSPVSTTLLLPSLPEEIALIYQSNRSGAFQIYHLDREWKETQLTTEGNNTEPRWSHDGKQIAYTANSDIGKYEVYVMDSSGNNKHPLLKGMSGYNWAPDWAPDDKRILFSSNASGQAQVYIVGLDGQSPQQITSGTGNSFLAAWSPDGKRIAFTSDRVDGSNEIYIMDIDGNNLTRLTENVNIDDAAPAWSPDGTQLAFHSHRDSNFEIYIITLPNKELRRVTTTPDIDERYPRWINKDYLIVTQTKVGTTNLGILDIKGSLTISSTLGALSDSQYADVLRLSGKQ